MSWLTGWQYRKSHDIRGSQAGAVTDYQMRITVHYGSGTDSGEHVYLNGKCRTDFGDIRFTSDDGVTELSYWMEEKVDSNYAVFWVRVPSIPKQPKTTTIYIYYGNSSASTTSNGANTFPYLFDHFLGNSLDTSIWDLVRGTASVSGSIVQLNATDGEVINSDWSEAGINYAVRCRCKRTYSTYDRWMAIWVRDQDYTPYIYSKGYMFTYYSGQSIIFESNGSGITSKDTGTGVPANTWVVIEVKVYETTHKDSDHGLTDTDSTYTTGHIGLGVGDDNVMYVDWILVRKYVEPEPTHNVWGSEETSVPEETPISTKALYNTLYVETSISTKALYNTITILETPISGKALYNILTIPETPISAKALYNVLVPNIRVIVTNESVTPNSGFAGDIVTYNAIVKDEYGNPLPEEFIADLLMNSTVVVDNQQFVAGVYDSSTGELTLVFTVPSLPSGIKTVKLKWEEQTI